MIDLPVAFSAALNRTSIYPVLLVEICIYTGAVDGVPQYSITRVTDVGHDAFGSRFGYLLDGHFYERAIIEPIRLQQSMSAAIDNVSLMLDNVGQDRPWSLLYNTTPAYYWLKSRVKIYRTLKGQADRVQIYEGFLDPPNAIGDRFELTSRQLISSIYIEFPAAEYSRTCPWVAQFAQGRRCNYVGEETSCSGSYADCTARGMTHRFAGIRTIQITGSYTYKEVRRFWFDKKKTGTYQSEENSSFLGNPIPVIYGKVRIEADPIWYVDTGAINKYVIILGWGPIGGIVDAPDLGRRDVSDPSSKNPAIVIDNKRSRDYAVYFGWDGSEGQSTPQTWDPGPDGQQIDYLWNNDPAYQNSYAGGEGQTYSRMAYIIGALPSTDAKEPDRAGTFEVYLHGRVIDTYYGSDTTPDARGDGAPDWRGQYDDNPAWVLLDILTNKDYGAGLDLSNFDISSFRSAAYICNDQGFKFCHAFKERLKIDEAAQLVLNSCRGYLIYTAGRYRLEVQYQDGMDHLVEVAPDVYTFAAGQIILGSDSYMVGARDQASNQVEVGFLDYDQDYQVVPRILDDVEHQQASGKRERHPAKYVGVVGFEQANRLAYWALNNARIERRKDGMKQVSGDLRTMHLEIGDCVKLDLSDLDLQDPDLDPETYDGIYQIVSISWAGEEAAYLLRKAESTAFDTSGIAPDVDIPPTRSRSRYPLSVRGPISADPLIMEATDSVRTIILSWQMPTGDEDEWAPMPVWVDLFWRTEDEEPYERRFIKRVRAADCYATFVIPYDECWNTTIVVYFATVSAWGVVQPCEPKMDVLHRTELTANVDDETTAWPVSDETVFDLDLIPPVAICGTELVVISSVSSGMLTLAADPDTPGLRATYNRTTRRMHLAGDYVGRAVPVAAVASKLIRDISESEIVTFTVTADGPMFTARWSNPQLPTRDIGGDPFLVPDACIDYYEICYSPNADFNAADPDSPDTIWVADLGASLNEKHGYDPTGAYYWAIRAAFPGGVFTPWKYLTRPSGEWVPPLNQNNPLNRLLVSARKVATKRPDDDAAPEALILADNSALEGVDLRGAYLSTLPGSSTASRMLVDDSGMKLYYSTQMVLHFDAGTGDISFGDLPSGARVFYDASAKTLNLTGAAISGGGGAVITKEAWTGNGVASAFDFSALRAAGNDPIVSVNGVIQAPGINYAVSDGASYTTITFTGFIPASGDAIIAWYQKG